MYFGNISDKEMTIFHQMTKINKNWSLTEVINSDLFKVETINENIYRIYPLFYCDEIQSTNPNDRILDNQCIICENNTETRLFFNSAGENDFDYTVREHTLNDKTFIDFICYSTVDGEPIRIVDITAEEYNTNNDVLYRETYTTDYHSNYIYQIRKQNTVRVEFTFNNQSTTKTYTWEAE